MNVFQHLKYFMQWIFIISYILIPPNGIDFL